MPINGMLSDSERRWYGGVHPRENVRCVLAHTCIRIVSHEHRGGVLKIGSRSRWPPEEA